MSLSRLLLVAALLLASAAHASEVALSEPHFVPATGAQARTTVSVASGGGTDLVLWMEEYPRFNPPPPASVVYMRTYEAGGVPLQPTHIKVGGSFGAGAVSGALAVWNGRDYFVAYGLYFPHHGADPPSPEVEAVRVTAEGRVIEGSRVSLNFEARPFGGSINALAWDGAHYFASISVFGTSQPKLLLLDRDGHAVSSQDGSALSIAALPGGGFAMLRVVSGQLELVRVARDGGLSTGATLGPAGKGEAKIEVQGDRIAVVRHTASGVVAEELDNDGRELVSVALPDDATIRSVVWRGSSWLAAYDHPSGGCIVRFGSGVDSSTTCSPTARQPFVAVDRAAWVENGVEVRTSGDLSLAGGNLASVTATTQSDTAAVATRTGLLVAWFEAGAMHLGGLVHDGSRRGERLIDAEAEPHHPALATAGAQTLLVYADGNAYGSGAVRALRLDMDGQPLAPAFTVGHGSAPSVASDGHEWLVVWQSSDGTRVRPQLLAARVTANGDATSEVLVFANDAAQWNPRVAWSGAGYLIAWSEGELAPSGPHWRVMTQIVDRNGARTGNAQTLLDDNNATLYMGPFACGPGSCLVTWTTWTGSRGDLHDAVIAPDGARRSENRLLLKDGARSAVAIVPVDGGTFHLACGNLYLFLDATGAPLATVTWLNVDAGVAGIVDGRIVYGRVTAPEEFLEGATRLFAREEPAPPRMRAAVH
jgi:hypothetical protein